MLRCSRAIRVLLFALGMALSLWAAPRDRAARAKIQEALGFFYEQKPERAESMLKAIVLACEDRCSAAVLAEAWMYIGIVRGSRGQLEAAGEAFATALSVMPEIELDSDIATEPTRGVWAGIARARREPPREQASVTKAEGTLRCSLAVREVESARPIPIACESEDEEARPELHYRAPGGRWNKLAMKPRRGAFAAEIPCDATSVTGTLELYVVLRDGSEVIERWGSRKEPIRILLVAASSQDPPALPGMSPPERCPEPGSCPLVGCPCRRDRDCERALVCRDRVCVAETQCKKHEDCGSARCVKGACVAKLPRRIWVGIELGQDFAYLSGDDVCARGDERYACFDLAGAPYSSAPQPGSAGRIDGGFVPATSRVLATFDLGVTRKLFAGLRAGFAPLGGGPSGFFLPHLELRASYFPGGPPDGDHRLRPFLLLGAGAAQIDAPMAVGVRDCALGLETDPADTRYAVDSAAYRECALGSPGHPAHRGRTLEAYLRLGRGFGLGGAGLGYSLGRVLLRAQAAALVLFPSAGVALEPSLGVGYGF